MIALHPGGRPWWPYSRPRAFPALNLFGPALETNNLSLGYPGHPTVLEQIQSVILAGSLVWLTGANGSGKSTFLKAIAGLLPAKSGTVQWFGRPPKAMRERLAYLPQRTALDWSFPVSVERFALAGRYVHQGWFRKTDASDRAWTQRQLRRLNIEAVADQPIAELSGGQQQRLLIARALTQAADILLLDEPLNHLDQTTRADLFALWQELTDAGKTLIVAAHEPPPQGHRGRLQSGVVAQGTITWHG